MSDPLFLKTIVRILLVLMAAYFGFLGYKLLVRDPATGKGPGLFLIVAAGLIAIGVSFTGGSSLPGFWNHGATTSSARAADKAELVRQIAVLQQADKQYQTVIREMRNQLSSAKTNNLMSPSAIGQLEDSLNAAAPSLDLNSLYTEMLDLSDLVDSLQSENEALRAEIAALRTEPAPARTEAPQ